MLTSPLSPPACSRVRRTRRAPPPAACPYFNCPGREAGEAYLDAVVTSFEWPTSADSHGLLNLLSSAPGLAPDACALPLLLPPSVVAAMRAAVQASALPAALSGVEELHMKDVRGLYVNSLEAAEGGAEFRVHDLAGGSVQWVPAGVADVLGMAIRLHQPVQLARSAVLEAYAAVLPELALRDETSAEDAAACSRLQMLVSECAANAPLSVLWSPGFVKQVDWACDSGSDDFVAPILQELRELQARGVLSPR